MRLRSQNLNKLYFLYQYNEYKPFEGKGESGEEEEKGSGETPSAEDIDKNIKSNPEKAALVLKRDIKDAGVKIDDETETALATQFDKIKRDS